MIMTKLPVRILFSILLVLLAVVVAVDALDLQQRQPAAQMSAAPSALPPVGKDSVKFLVHRRQRHRRPGPDRNRAANVEGAQRVPVRVRHHARRQHVRLRAPAGLRAQVRGAVQAAARRQDRVLCRRSAITTTRTRCITSRSAWAASGSTPIRRRTSASSRSTATTWTRTSSAGSRQELAQSKSKWKIAYFHHPIYSSGGRHGSEVDLRSIIEPLFIKYDAQRGDSPGTSISTSG